MKILHNVRVLQISAGQLHTIDKAAITWQGQQLMYVGTRADMPRPDVGAEWIDGCNALATPALIDCHTHVVFGGNRSEEFAARLSGMSYSDIAKAGGGIRTTVRHTRAATEAQLLQSVMQRAQAMRRGGVGTLEIKSGYGLDLATETKMLRVATQLSAQTGMRVRRTYLGLHAFVAEEWPSRTAMLEAVCNSWLPQLHAQGLVDAVDAFQENIAFNADEVRQFFAAAKALRIPVKLHAEQLSNTQGAALAAAFGALSADHLEYLDDSGIAAMQAAGTVAVLLPSAFYCLRESQLPPIAKLRAAGVPMAIATDCNPGTAPNTSLRLAMHQACTLFGLSIPEALAGVTDIAARALGLVDTGQLRAGFCADIALWQVDHAAEIVYWLGDLPAQQLYVAGRKCEV
jgi:imidazolonepropionase